MGNLTNDEREFIATTGPTQDEGFAGLPYDQQAKPFAYPADYVRQKHHEIAALVARNRELERALKSVEWTDGVYGYGYCRLCGDPWIEDANAEHTSVCIIGNVLKGAQ